MHYNCPVYVSCLVSQIDEWWALCPLLEVTHLVWRALRASTSLMKGRGLCSEEWQQPKQKAGKGWFSVISYQMHHHDLMWLVLRWMLPFLQASSMLVNYALDDRWLPDQCWVVPDLIQWSRARCCMIGLIGGPSSLAEGPHWPKWLECGPWMDQCKQCCQKTSDMWYRIDDVCK